MVRKLRSFHIRNLPQLFAPAPIDKVPYCYSFGQQIVRITGVTKDQNTPLNDFPTTVTFKPCKSELLSYIFGSVAYPGEGSRSSVNFFCTEAPPSCLYYAS